MFFNCYFKISSFKIFIRSAQTFFKLEDDLTRRKHELITKIKAYYKAYKKRKAFKRIRMAGKPIK